MIGNSGSEFSTLGTKDRKRDVFFRHTHVISSVPQGDQDTLPNMILRNTKKGLFKSNSI